MDYSQLPSQSVESVSLSDCCEVSFAPLEKARELLGNRDEFTSSTSPTDRLIRMRTEQPPSEVIFRTFLAEQALPWEPAEIAKIGAALTSIRSPLAGIAAQLPGRIWLVKTNGEEEFFSAYTRGSAVILPPNKIAYPTPPLERLLVHEIFHIASRYNPRLRQALYAVIGFHPCGEIQIPAVLQAGKITNPDAPRNDYYIRITSSEGEVAVVPIICLKDANRKNLRGEEFFQELELLLLRVQEAQAAWKAVTASGQPVCLRVDQVAHYFEQVGRNAGNIMHPEEIIAENFTHQVFTDRDLPSPEILPKIEKALVELCEPEVIHKKGL